jgi:hypothetical protein
MIVVTVIFLIVHWGRLLFMYALKVGLELTTVPVHFWNMEHLLVRRTDAVELPLMWLQRMKSKICLFLGNVVCGLFSYK